MEKQTPLQDLQRKIESREIDTIILCAPDMQGRLAGKRVAAAQLLRERQWIASDRMLSLDLDCRPIAACHGAEGEGFFCLRPDMDSLRHIPWLPASALVLCDLADRDGTAVAHAPRQTLRRQQERLLQLGLRARFAMRTGCYVFEDSYDGARAKAYGELTRKGATGQACNILESGRQESLLRAVRTHLAAADVPVVESTGMSGPGQHEIALEESAPVAAADAHVLLKHGMKELAVLHERAVTFLAQWSEEHPGSGCVVSASLQGPDGSGLFDAGDPQGMSQLCRSWLAGQLHLAREMCLFFAPFANSYRRFAARGDMFRRPVWRRDDFGAPLRVMGQGGDARLEWEWGGADINPYLALAAITAAGLHGIEQELQPPPAGEPLPDAAQAALPRSLEEAIGALQQSTVLRAAFGDGVVEHCLHVARWELQRQESEDKSSDCRDPLAWQVRRGFEQA